MPRLLGVSISSFKEAKGTFLTPESKIKDKCSLLSRQEGGLGVN